MDYLFVHDGGDTFEARAKEALQRRTTPTTLIPQTNDVYTIQDFLAELAKPGVTRPIGDLLLVSHASSEGWFQMRLDMEHGDADVEYEHVVEANQSNNIRIPITLMTNPANGAVSSLTVRIHGCAIGNARPWLEAFRDALTPPGATIAVIAPKFLDGMFPASNGEGWFEFLYYRFRIFSKTRLTRDVIVSRFESSNFTRADGRAITHADWNWWVEARAGGHDMWSEDFAVVFGSYLDGTTVKLLQRYSHDSLNGAFPLRNVTTDPGSDAQRTGLMKQRMEAFQQGGQRPWHSSHPFPRYKREGFATLDDWINGRAWKFTHDKKNSRLLCNWTMHQYRIDVPVLEELVDAAGFPNVEQAREYLSWYNFYSTNPVAFPDVTRLDENNATFYQKV